MKVLCTFSGKYGDILWSLPTARQIAKDIAGGQVDFAMMPYYESLCPLIEEQEYIGKCFVIPDWIRTHSNHGDGPWEAPVQTVVAEFPKKDFNPPVGEFCVEYKKGDWRAYDKVFHLTYRGHPGINAPSMPLVDFIAYQQGIQLEQPVIPFLTVKPEEHRTGLSVAVAFNEQYKEQKDQFFKAFFQRYKEIDKFGMSSALQDVSTLPWLNAAEWIAGADLFVGCRSANWVVAMALGKQTVTFEPHPSRHAACHLGKVFGCPHGREFSIPYMMPPHAAAEVAAGIIKKKLEEIKNRSNCAKATNR